MCHIIFTECCVMAQDILSIVRGQDIVAFFFSTITFLLKIYSPQERKLRMVCLYFLIRLIFKINTYVMQSDICRSSWSIK